FPDACALGMAFHSGEADPVDIARRCLAEAEKAGTVYLCVTAARALAEAEDSRRRYQDKIPYSLFDGVPVNWKDTFDVAGTVTTSGSAVFENDPPVKTDGPLSDAATQAGMVCLGKVNTCEFAYSSVGVNRHFGSPINPWSAADAPRTCGGSSSGSAASVAAGLIPVSIGSDAGGSIRVPASFTGICGFKPTSGRYAPGGMKALARTLDSPGPMTRSVRDLIVMDAILRGEMPGTVPVAPALPGLRFVVDASLLEDALITDGVRRVFEEAVRRLIESGADVDYRTVQSFHDARKSMANGWIIGAEVFTELKPLLDNPETAASMDQRIRRRAEQSRNMPPNVVVQSYWDRRRLTEAMRDDLQGAVLILPSVAYSAPLLHPLEADDEAFAASVQNNPRLTAAGNFMNMPAVALPVGLDENGMPIGASLYRAAGEDQALLAAALAAESSLSGHTSR
ncbi:MAG: amidase, partial [Oxalobacter sp.]|nr:amidase [Oxalobacter sp.]